MLHSFIELLLSITESMGYTGIIALMTVESSFIPFPSEVVVPPAAFLARQGEMNIFLVTLSGIIGSLIGASINYFLALKFGRKIIYSWAGHKLAKTLLITPKKINVAEDYFLKYGKVSTFFGRLVPAVRQLISIPAGFSKMKFKTFIFFTFLGSSTWTIILALLGYYFWDSKELFEKYYSESKYFFVALTALLIVFIIFKIKKNSNKIKTIFIGTPDFGAPALESLINDNYFDVIGIVTQPDKKVGRKQILTSPPIKQIAQNHNIPVHQPMKIKDLDLNKIKCDLIVVIAYAQIIPETILNLPKHGCVNVHGSLLPLYRGASCIQAAILNGDKKTGITIMQMDKGLDTGNIIKKEEIEINQDDTTGVIFDKLSALSGEILPKTLKNYISKKLIPLAQDDSLSSYVGLLKKEDGRINWNKNAIDIERHIRAMSPWPGAFSTIKKEKSKIKNLKIIKVSTNIINSNEHKTSELFLNDNKLAVQCNDNVLLIEKLQLEGKKIMSSEEFLNGYSKYISTILK